MISDIGKNIKKERIKNKISMEELSRKANVGISTVSEIESGKRKELRSETIVKIAKALNVDISKIITKEKNLIDTNKSLDLLENVNSIISCDEISIDGKIMSKEEKIEFIKLTKMYINSVIETRRK